MNTDTIDKTSDVWWAENGEGVCEQASHLPEIIKDDMLSDCLYERVEEFILRARSAELKVVSPECVANARHDLCVLAGMSGGDK